MLGGAKRAIDVVESGYRLDLDESTWLAELVTLTAADFDLGAGVIANIVDKRAARVRSASWTNVTPALEASMLAVHASPPPTSQNTFRADRRGFLSISERFPHDPLLAAAWENMLAPLGYTDGISLMARGIDDGLELWAPTTEAQQTSPSARRAWDRIATHLSAAMRLRRGSANTLVDREQRADAILDPAGRLLHIRGPGGSEVRSSLRRAVLDSEKARGALRRTDPHAALELWKGLVHGTWSLVDHFDSDGKRFIVALENPVEVRDPRALTQREASAVLLALERATPKEIAYAVGISPSNARAVLASALRKLHIRSRTELERFKLETGEVFELHRDEATVAVLSLREPVEDAAVLSRLTAAERAVATLAANGHTNHEIAKARRSSVRTVANQMQSILRKLGVGSRIELARFIASK